ncbi:unnamed protein product [Allacma fusca]|uniref:Retrotransposon gag domain-containing protein n=1 Tax=Allacma fusca TaxID=39272 RepID=A0A8J2KU27_9HEXA|nr:unnamed protein product [Allacma fusca]
MADDDDEPPAPPKVVRYAITAPKYSGIRGSDPGSHVSAFKIASEANAWDEAMSLLQFPSTLTGYALSWYASAKGRRQRERNPFNWRTLVDEFIANSTQGIYYGDDEFSLVERTQKEGESGQAYFYVTDQLADRADDDMSDERRIRYIKRGLLPAYFKQANPARCDTMKELLQLLQGIDESIERDKRQRIIKQVDDEPVYRARQCRTQGAGFAEKALQIIEERLKKMEVGKGSINSDKKQTDESSYGKNLTA